MVKKCKNSECKNTIAEQYEYCISCVNKYKEGSKESSINQELLKTLQHINWNLGNIAKAAMKMAKTEPLEKLKDETN